MLVVDRPGLDPGQRRRASGRCWRRWSERTAEKLADSPASAAVGPRVTGAEVGALLSYLAPKVLGQFDPFFPGAPDRARRPAAAGGARTSSPSSASCGVDPSDFRLWVCLHEETHRVQFTAVPWLRDHLNAQIAEIVGSTELDTGALAADARATAARRIAAALRNGEELSVVDLVQTPAQRETVDRITAVMSLLEGHADVVMDSVGPDGGAQRRARSGAGSPSAARARASTR